MILALLTLLTPLLCVSADNSTNSSNHCQALPGGASEIGGFLLHGNKYFYAQQRFGPPIIAEKCWRLGIFPWDFNLLDNSLNPTFTFYDPRVKHRNVKVKMAFIGNRTKYSIVYGGREIILTTIALTPDYAVNYFCRGNEHAVVIATTKKHRDEEMIQRAIKDAKKIVNLPSPSVNMECDELVDETPP